MISARWLHFGIVTLTCVQAALFAAAAPIDLAPELEAQNEAVATLYSEGHYAEGIELVHEHLEFWAATRGVDSPEYCSMASNLGPLLSMAGDLEAAETAHREGLACLRRTFGPESEDLASALNNYGSHLGRAADMGRAELALRESIRLLRKTLGEDHVYVAITLNNLGVNQQNQGNDVAAERTLRDAVARLRASLGDDHPTTATAVNNLGRLLSSRGELDEAEPLLREALSVREAQLGPDHRDTSIGRRDLGRLLRRQNRFEEAEAQFREALAGFAANLGPDHPEVAMSRHELGRVLVDQKRFDEARDEFIQALALYEKHYEAGHSAQIQLQTELGELAFARNRLTAANERFLAATTVYELGRQRSGQGLSRATYLDSPWLALAAVRLELDDPDGAWEAFETAQGRVLEEALTADGAQAPVRVTLDEGTAMIGWFDVELGGERRAWAWSLVDGDIRWHRLPEPVLHARAIEAFRGGIAQPGPLGRLRRLAHDVWRHRFSPLEDELAGVEHVVIVSACDMLGLPIGALVDDQERWLADRWSFSYAPSAGAYALLRGHRPSAPGPALFVGDPELRGRIALAAHSRRPSDDVIRGATHGVRESIDELPSLPGTRDEVLTLSEDWSGSTTLLGADASESALAALAADDKLVEFRVLHFATHALVDTEDADASALVLSQTGLPAPLEVLAAGDRLIDGLVTTREIIDEWRLDADLVTLSACNSALGRTVTGEGLVGFAHAFLSVGARSLLVSQWSVPDRATMVFMTAFYDAWRREGASRAGALASAQQSLRGHRDVDGRLLYEHPYYWAPFVLVGDER